MRKTNFIMLLLFLPAFLFAQKKSVKGTVKDKYGEPIIGVNVILKNTAIGAITDFDGVYEVVVPKNVSTTLVFSFLGFQSEEIVVGDKARIDVVLQSSNVELDEVVVTALGIKREQKSLTYARQSINTEDMAEARTNNFLNNIAGKASGVQVVSSGTSTGSNRVVIRGITSVQGNNQPLYIIDGIEVSSPQGDDGVNANSGGIDYGNPISQINPDDIESIEVLKGANAAALYGSQAANGVVLITTKQGRKTKGLGVSVNYNMSFTNVLEYPGYQYTYGSGNAGKIAANAAQLDDDTGLPLVGVFDRAFGAPLLGQDVIDVNNTQGTYTARPGNIKELYETGVTKSTNVSIQNANEKSSYRLSYTHLDGENVVRGLDIQQRDNVSFRGSYKLSKSVTSKINIIYAKDLVKNRIFKNGNNRNPANNYIYMKPNYYKGNLLPYKDPLTGIAYTYQGAFVNPYWNLGDISNQDETDRLLVGTDLNWRIASGLNLNMQATTDYRSRVGERFTNFGASYDIDGFYSTFDDTNRNLRLRAMLLLNKKYGKISLNSSLGVTNFYNTSSRRATSIDGLSVPDLKSLQNVLGFPRVTESDSELKTRSVFGQLSLGYDKTVFLEATARNDWSSTLPEGNNSFFYPSLGASFVFTELLPKSDALSYGKFRFSYAQVGSGTQFNRISTNLQYGGQYQGVPWYGLPLTKNNSDLKPELTESFETGFEAFFFKKRVKLDVTAYKSLTNNQIISVQVSKATGFNNQFINAGEIENKGLELALSVNILKGGNKGLNWDTSFNLSTNRSKVVSLIDGIDRISLGNFFNANVYAEVGKPLGEIRGGRIAKDEKTGHTLLKNNGQALFENNVRIGNAQPDWLGGLRNSFRYKNFSLSILLDAKIGGDLLVGTLAKSINTGLHTSTLEGREASVLSSLVLGENNNERRGIGLFGNDYADTREKGVYYKNAALGQPSGAGDGKFVVQRDNAGNILTRTHYLEAQQYHFDRGGDQSNLIYDASYIKLREINIGYTLPKKLVSKAGLQSVKVSAVARNLWYILRNTPKGIDPEASFTSGNGQGIEFGSQLPTYNLGFNVNVKF